MCDKKYKDYGAAFGCSVIDEFVGLPICLGNGFCERCQKAGGPILEENKWLREMIKTQCNMGLQLATASEPLKKLNCTCEYFIDKLLSLGEDRVHIAARILKAHVANHMTAEKVAELETTYNLKDFTEEEVAVINKYLETGRFQAY